MYIGVDLALPGKRRTGIGIIDINEHTYYTTTVASQHEIIETISNNAASKGGRALACIDAPLGLPKYGINRMIEITARRRGLRLIPPLLGPMKSLTMYGIDTANKLKQLGIEVFEVHPTSTLKILNMSRQEFLNYIRSVLRGSTVNNEHEIDALVAAFTCLLHDHECTEEISGYEGEGSLIIPQSGCDLRVIMHGSI
ncbi:MAG: DUF429 domain-containing protein [Vulcanisaeta sp.]